MMPDEPMIYHGGPYDGERVDLVGILEPAEIIFADHLPGRYVWNAERERYEWWAHAGGEEGA